MKVLTINRVSGETERMRITAADGGVQVLRIELSLEQMMLAITGQAIIVKDWAGHDGPCEVVANWMLANSYATGHGDTLEDLLGELVAQVRGSK